MQVLWHVTTQDASSNITGSSVFDFDGDGRAEVVYNDEAYIRIYPGLDGTVLAQVAQNSHTLIEYPLIVDVDADGNAEIVFAANAAVNRCAAIPGYDGLRAGIRVFRDATDNWVGTRPVWNEHTYHVTNVRESLGIPRSEIPNWTRFNTFRQNSQSFDAPDLVAAEPTSDGDGCPDALVLRATIRNDGAVTVAPGLPVTFYLGTPAMPGRAVATVRRPHPRLSARSTPSSSPAASASTRSTARSTRITCRSSGSAPWRRRRSSSRAGHRRVTPPTRPRSTPASTTSGCRSSASATARSSPRASWAATSARPTSASTGGPWSGSGPAATACCAASRPVTS
jgi:hypothetical protein